MYTPSLLFTLPLAFFDAGPAVPDWFESKPARKARQAREIEHRMRQMPHTAPAGKGATGPRRKSARRRAAARRRDEREVERLGRAWLRAAHSGTDAEEREAWRRLVSHPRF